MKNTAIGLLTAVSFFVLPFVTSRHLFYASVNAKFFFVIGFVSILVLLFAYGVFKKKINVGIRAKRVFLFLLLSVLLAYILSAFFGVFPEKSFWSDILRSTGVFFLFFIAILAFILGESTTEKDWSTIRRSVAVSSGLFALATIIGVEGLGFEGRFLWTNLGINGFTFGNTTFAGVYLLLGMILSVIEFIRTPLFSRWRWVLAGSAVISFLSPLIFNIGIFLGKTPIGDVFGNPALILGSARASSATAIFLVIFFVGRFLINKYSGESRRGVVAKTWNGLWIAGLLISVFMLFVPGSFIQNAYIKESTSARIIVWNSGLEAFKEKPFLGWGPENFDHAFEKHFDNRLFLDENLGEIWFDTAHNVVVDTLIEVGVVGVVLILGAVFWFLVVVNRARKRDLIQSGEAMILSFFPFAHFLQLQTGFDTVGSYALLAVFLGYALWLEKKMVIYDKEKESSNNSTIFFKTVAIFLVASALLGFYHLVIKEYGRQKAILVPFTTRDAEKQMTAINRAFSRISDFETLRLLSASFIKGSLEEMATTGATSQVIQSALTRTSIYEDAFKKYLELDKDSYRARMNYAHLLLIKTTLGENSIDEAQSIIRDSYVLSPSHPLTFSMEALSELYKGDIKRAKELAQKAIDINPNIEFSHQVMAHIEAQEKKFPRISVLKLENI